MPKSELAFVHWLRSRTTTNPLRVPIPIGDDMAGLRTRGDLVFVTADMLMDTVDFETAKHTPAQIGRKALACSLSDCAAMAVMPIGFLASVALPNSWTMEQAQQLIEGMLPLAEQYHCPLVGGDTNSWNHPLVIDITVLAQPFPQIAPVRRNGAKPGDSLYVSGPLGGSILGRHLTFEPLINEARRLAETLGPDLRAMLDLSDGLSLDAARLADASNVGIELNTAAIEQRALHTDTADLSKQTGRAALDHALSDGEDFELLAAVARTDDFLETPVARWSRIGQVVESGLWLIDPTGHRAALEPKGWEHFRDA